MRVLVFPKPSTQTCMLYAKNEAQRDAVTPMPERAMKPGLPNIRGESMRALHDRAAHMAAPKDSNERSLMMLTRLPGHS